MNSHYSYDSFVDKVEDWSRLPIDPLVSVLMITYNHEAYIREALQSILMQQVSFPYEIVIGEDKSTDSTRHIVLEYQRRYPEKIRVRLAKENLFSQRINPTVGVLNSCRGMYVALLEGDDYWTDPLKMQKQVNIMEEHPDYAGCFHDANVLNAKTQQQSKWLTYNKTEFGLQDTINETILCHTCSFFFKRTVLQSLPSWYSNIDSGDMVIFFLVAEKGMIGRIPETMSVYRKHPSGMSSQAHLRERKLHYSRLRLFLALKKHLGSNANNYSWNALDQHLGAILGHKGRRNTLIRILTMCIECPGIVFNHNIIQRLLSCLITS
jgi:glycosyltransferase involved in cell wall biosynthesis